MKKIVIIGANGQLGSELLKVYKDAVPLTHEQIEIGDKQSVKKSLDRWKPGIVINTAAMHNLEQCELKPQTAWAVNVMGVKYLADWCKENKAILVHTSTDYVFGGNISRKKPYMEDDAIAPQSVYAISKAAGEFLVKNLPRYFLIRTCGLYGVAGSQVKGGNFVDKRIDQITRGEIIHMVADQIVSPTYTVNLAQNMKKLLATRHYGVYHMSSTGSCSWFEFTKEILKLTGLKTKVVPVKSPQGSIRPNYSVLSKSKLTKLGLNYMNSWQKNLRLYLYEKGLICL